jgi:flagellar basal body P-ring formation protein FlgA
MTFLHVIVMSAAVASTTASSQTLPAAQISREVEAVLSQRLRDAGSSARIVAVRGVRDQSLPPGRVVPEVGAVPGRWPRARVGVPVRLSVDGRTIRIVTAWVETTDPRRVLTYTQASSAKSAAEGLHLSIAEVDMTCCIGTPVAQTDSLEGLRLRRAVRAGEPVLASDFETLPDVSERDQVQIVVARGDVRIRTVGIALADGRIGQRVTVRPDLSERAVSALVVAKKQVLIDEATF